MSFNRAMAGMVLGAMAGEAMGFGFPTSGHVMRATELRHLRGMVNKNESPWVTFHRLIARGEVRLVKRRNKPPLLIPLPDRRGRF